MKSWTNIWICFWQDYSVIFPSVCPVKCYKRIWNQGTSNTFLIQMHHRWCNHHTALTILCVKLRIFWNVTLSLGVIVMTFWATAAPSLSESGSHDTVLTSHKTSTFNNAAARTSNLAVHSTSEVCNPLLPSHKYIHNQNKWVTYHLKSHTGSNLKSMLATNCSQTLPSKFSSRPNILLHK